MTPFNAWVGCIISGSSADTSLFDSATLTYADAKNYCCNIGGSLPKTSDAQVLSGLMAITGGSAYPTTVWALYETADGANTCPTMKKQDITKYLNSQQSSPKSTGTCSGANAIICVKTKTASSGDICPAASIAAVAATTTASVVAAVVIAVIACVVLVTIVVVRQRRASKTVATIAINDVEMTQGQVVPHALAFSAMTSRDDVSLLTEKPAFRRWDQDEDSF